MLWPALKFSEENSLQSGSFHVKKVALSTYKKPNSFQKRVAKLLVEALLKAIIQIISLLKKR